MTRLKLQVRRLGPHFRTVLVSGEPGTGKKLAARALHRLSQGVGERFVICDAAAMSDWSTSTDKAVTPTEHLDRMVRMAQGGTLFFDGIGEMPMEAQVQLLRVLRLQERSHVGLAPQKVDLRIIASTREDLKILTFSRRFRQELYQRLAMVEIALPPLRDRIEDIPELAMWFLRRSLLYGMRIERIAEDAIALLQAHRWPGNVRELDSVLRRGFLQCDGAVMRANHLPALEELDAEEASVSAAAGTARLQEVVEQHVLRVLKNCGGNKLRAAELLGISRSTLYRMLDSTASFDNVTQQGRMVKGGRYTG
jgi:DNA-binding NtrC family response regulator